MRNTTNTAAAHVRAHHDEATLMKGAVLYGVHDVRYVDRDDPKIVEPTDAIIRMSATCLRLRSLALPRHRRAEWPNAYGSRVLRRRRGSWPRREKGQTRPVRHRLTHGVEIPGLELFFAEVHLLGGPAPVRRYLPELIDLVWQEKINPGKVFNCSCRSSRWPRGIARWTSGALSRRCSYHDSSITRMTMQMRHPSDPAYATLHENTCPSPERFSCAPTSFQVQCFLTTSCPTTRTPGGGSVRYKARTR